MRTPIAARDDLLKHMPMTGHFQSIQKATEDVSRLFNDNIYQLYSCLDRLAAFALNGLQLFQSQGVALKHVTRDALCVYCCRYFIVEYAQNIGVT